MVGEINFNFVTTIRQSSFELFTAEDFSCAAMVKSGDAASLKYVAMWYIYDRLYCKTIEGTLEDS